MTLTAHTRYTVRYGLIPLDNTAPTHHTTAPHIAGFSVVPTCLAMPVVLVGQQRHGLPGFCHEQVRHGRALCLDLTRFMPPAYAAWLFGLPPTWFTTRTGCAARIRFIPNLVRMPEPTWTAVRLLPATRLLPPGDRLQHTGIYLLYLRVSATVFAHAPGCLRPTRMCLQPRCTQLPDCYTVPKPTLYAADSAAVLSVTYWTTVDSLQLPANIYAFRC